MPRKIRNQLAGYIRRNPSKPIWYPVVAGNDAELYEAAINHSVIASTQDEAVELLGCMNPIRRRLPPIFTHVAVGDMWRLSDWEGYNYPRRILVLEDLIYTGGDDDELLAVLRRLPEGVLLGDTTLQEARENWPAEDGLYVRIESYQDTLQTQHEYYKRGRRRYESNEVFVRLTYNERRSVRSASAKKAAVTRKAATKDDLRDFMNRLHGDLPFGLDSHRTGWESADTSHIISEINRLLGIHECVFGRKAYRRTDAYIRFFREVLATERATLAKFKKYDCFYCWLVTELRSRAVRELKRVGFLKNRTTRGNLDKRITDPFGAATTSEEFRQERELRADAQTKKKEEAATCDRWAWTRPKEEKISGAAVEASGGAEAGDTSGGAEATRASRGRDGDA